MRKIKLPLRFRVEPHHATRGRPPTCKPLFIAMLIECLRRMKQWSSDEAIDRASKLGELSFDSCRSYYWNDRYDSPYAIGLVNELLRWPRIELRDIILAILEHMPMCTSGNTTFELADDAMILDLVPVPRPVRR